MDRWSSTTTLERLLQHRWAGWALNLIVLALIVIALFLPPLSLGKHLASGPGTAIGGKVWTVTDPDGTELTILPVGLPKDAKLSAELSSVPRAELEAGTADEDYQPLIDALPSYLTMKSPLYEIRVGGATPKVATLRIPIPNDAEPLRTLDVYGWSGEHWYRLDNRVREESDDILVQLDHLPEAAAVVQTQGQDLVLGASVPLDQPLSQKQLETLVEIYPLGGIVAQDGTILIEPSLSRFFAPDVRVMPSIRNWTEDGKALRGWEERRGGHRLPRVDARESGALCPVCRRPSTGAARRGQVTQRAGRVAHRDYPGPVGHRLPRLAGSQPNRRRPPRADAS